MSVVPYLAASVPLRLVSAGAAAAVPVLAVQELHSVAIGGGLVAASLAPSIVAAPLVGALLDRTRHPTRFMVLSGVVTAAAFALTALLGIVPTPVIAVGLVVAGAVVPFFMGGLSSFVADAVRGPADRASGLDALSYNIGSVAGPALAAGAIALGSARAAVLLLAVIAAAGAVGAAFLRLAPHPARPDRRSVLGEVVQGARVLATHRPIAVPTLSGSLSQIGQGALPIAAIGVALAATGSAGGAAWVVTGFAVGALAGALAVTARPVRRIPAVVVMAASFAATGALTIAAASGAGLPVVVVLVSLSGLASAPGVAALLLLRTRHSPRAMRSQVFTVASGLRATGAAVGAGLAGLLPSADGSLVLGISGAVWVASAAVLVGFPREAVRPADAERVS